MSIITISRGSLSGGELLAEQLAARLGSRVLSREVIVEAARKYGISENKLIDGLQSPPGFWDRLTHHKERYILAVQATLAEMVQDGSAIYHGLAGHILLKDLSRVIKLRLIAPMEYRIRSAMIELSLSREQAIRHIETVDERRARWVRQMYNVEWTDPSLYDMVLNLELMSIETATELVVDLAGRKEYRLTAEVTQERRDFALAARLRAELAFHSDFGPDAIDFKVRRGIVRIKGGGAYERNPQGVLSFVSGIDGVEDVVTPEGETPQASGRPMAGRETTAADIMLPMKRYPFVHQWVTIREAFSALSTSTISLDDGHVVRPRYILVHDRMEQLVGVIARRNLLRGINPQLKAMEQAMERAGELAHIEELSMPVGFQWISMFSAAALAHAEDPVEGIMAPIRASVRPDDGISAVVATMLHHSVDLIPVIDGRKPVGVILMTDVFDTVAEHIIERGKTTRPGAPDEAGESATSDAEHSAVTPS